MGGNSPIRYAKLRRALLRGGANEGAINGSHHNWNYRGIAQSIPVHHNQVKASYVRRLRQSWGLTREDGVSDTDFWNGDWGA